MLHTTRLLVVGSIHAVADDRAARAELSCGDKDAAFALVAESDDDVFAFLTPEDPGMSMDPESGYSQPGDAWNEEAQDQGDEEDEGIRFYFFCRHEEDRHWLHGACFAQPNGVGLAALEICPATGAGICLLRVPRGVRTIPILTAE